MTDVLVHASGLTKEFSSVRVLSDISIEFDGAPVEIREARDAKRIGIGLVPREFDLVATLNALGGGGARLDGEVNRLKTVA